MLSLLTRLIDAAIVLAASGPAQGSLALAGLPGSAAGAVTFAAPRTRHGGGKRSQPSLDTKESWADFGRGF